MQMTNTAGITSIPPIAELAPYASKILRTAQAAQNEEQLKIEVEDILRTICTSGTAAGIWIGYIFLDDFGRTKPAFLNSTGVMYPSVECILKLLYQCT